MIDEVVSPEIAEFEKPEWVLEIVEAAGPRGALVSVMNQRFWGSVINYTLLHFSSLSLPQLLELLTTLDKLGFQDLTIQ